MTDAQQRKLRKTFTVAKRDPSDRESLWDMKCLECGHRASGWRTKGKALESGYAHAKKDHAPGVLPRFSGTMREMLS